MAAITDRAFFQRIVDESIEIGYIHRPAYWNGHDFHHREIHPLEGNCFICCIPCYGRIDDKLSVVIGTVFFIFSSIIAFAYTLRSTHSACQANRDLSYSRLKSRTHHNELYSDAEILLDGRRAERTWVALSQGAMCVGAALLTATLLAALMVEGEFVFLQYGVAGAGLLVAGCLLYAGTKCFHFNDQQQEAAERISLALYPQH